MELCTEANHVRIDLLILGIYDAHVHFNDGTVLSLEVLKDMNMERRDHILKSL